jgi:hypothetical protein
MKVAPVPPPRAFSDVVVVRFIPEESEMAVVVGKGRRCCHICAICVGVSLMVAIMVVVVCVLVLVRGKATRNLHAAGVGED